MQSDYASTQFRSLVFILFSGVSFSYIQPKLIRPLKPYTFKNTLLRFPQRHFVSTTLNDSNQEVEEKSNSSRFRSGWKKLLEKAERLRNEAEELEALNKSFSPQNVTKKAKELEVIESRVDDSQKTSLEKKGSVLTTRATEIFKNKSLIDKLNGISSTILKENRDSSVDGGSQKRPLDQLPKSNLILQLEKPELYAIEILMKTKVIPSADEIFNKTTSGPMGWLLKQTYKLLNPFQEVGESEEKRLLVQSALLMEIFNFIEAQAYLDETGKRSTVENMMSLLDPYVTLNTTSAPTSSDGQMFELIENQKYLEDRVNARVELLSRIASNQPIEFPAFAAQSQSDSATRVVSNGLFGGPAGATEGEGELLRESLDSLCQWYNFTCFCLDFLESRPFIKYDPSSSRLSREEGARLEALLRQNRATVAGLVEELGFKLVPHDTFADFDGVGLSTKDFAPRFRTLVTDVRNIWYESNAGSILDESRRNNQNSGSTEEQYEAVMELVNRFLEEDERLLHLLAGSIALLLNHCFVYERLLSGRVTGGELEQRLDEILSRSSEWAAKIKTARDAKASEPNQKFPPIQEASELPSTMSDGNDEAIWSKSSSVTPDEFLNTLTSGNFSLDTDTLKFIADSISEEVPKTTAEGVVLSYFDEKSFLDGAALGREGASRFQNEILRDLFVVSEVTVSRGCAIFNGKLGGVNSSEALVERLEERLLNSEMGKELGFIVLKNDRLPSVGGGMETVMMDMLLGSSPAVIAYPLSWVSTASALNRNPLRKLWRTFALGGSLVTSAAFSATCVGLFSPDGPLAQAEPYIPVDFIYLSIAPLIIQSIALSVEFLVAQSKGIKSSAVPVPSFSIPLFGGKITYLSLPKNRNDVFDTAASGIISALFISLAATLTGFQLTLANGAQALGSLPTISLSLLKLNTIIAQFVEYYFPGVFDVLKSTPDATIHLHWVAIAGIISFIGNMFQLVPIDNSAGSKLSYSALDREIYSILSVVSGLCKAVFILFLIFGSSFGPSSTVTKPRLFGDFVIASQLVSDPVETDLARDNLSGLAEGRKILYFGMISMLLYSLISFNEVANDLGSVVVNAFAYLKTLSGSSSPASLF